MRFNITVWLITLLALCISCNKKTKHNSLAEEISDQQLAKIRKSENIVADDWDDAKLSSQQIKDRILNKRISFVGTIKNIEKSGDAYVVKMIGSTSGNYNYLAEILIDSKTAGLIDPADEDGEHASCFLVDVTDFKEVNSQTDPTYKIHQVSSSDNLRVITGTSNKYYIYYEQQYEDDPR